MSLIEQARIKINEIDSKMIELFKERMHAVLDVLKYKKEHNLAVFDEKREIELIQKNLNLLNNKDLEIYYLKFFQGVLDSSKDYQRDHYE